MDNFAEQVESFIFCLNSDEVKYSVNKINTVRGGLAKSLLYWRDTLSSSEFVLSVVREGCRIPLDSVPPTCTDLTNNKSARDQPEFVSDAILKLLNGGYVIECPTPPHCVNPLTVAKGKKLTSMFVSKLFVMKILSHYPTYLVKSTGFSHGTSNPATTTSTYILHIGNFWDFLGPLKAINAFLYLPCCHSG